VIVPKLAVTENLLNDHLFLNKRNDLHLATAVRSWDNMQSYSRLLIEAYIRLYSRWTFQRIDFINALDERRPRHATFTTICSIRLRHSGQCRHNRLFCLLCHPPFFVRILPVIANLVFTFVGNMLRNFGQKIQRIVYLIIPPHARRQVFVAGFRKRNTFRLSCPIKDLTIIGDTYHAGKRKRASRNIFYQTLHARMIPRLDTYGHIDAKAGMFPIAHIGHDIRIDFADIQ